MTLHWTWFDGAKSRDGVARSGSWIDLISEVETEMTCAADDKRELPALCPCAFAGTRAAANVVSMHSIMFDLDHDAPIEADLEGVSAFAYETPSSAPGARKLRVLFELSRPLSPREAKPARAALKAALGWHVDPQTENLDRLGFVGAIVGTAPRQCWTFVGEPLDVDALLAGAPEAHKPTPRVENRALTARELAAVEPCADALEPLCVAGSKHATALAWGGFARNAGRSEAFAVAVIDALDARGVFDEPDAKRAAVCDAYRMAAPAGASRLPPEVVAALDLQVAQIRGLGEIRIKAPGASNGAEPPYVIQRARRYWVRRPGRRDYFPERDAADAGATITTRYGATWPFVSQRGENIPLAALAGRVAHGADSLVVADAVTTDYRARGVEWDPETATIRAGVEPAAVPPVKDPAVATWLESLFSADLPAALDWIASCEQRHLDHLSTALAVVGGPGVGKSVLFEALGSLWGGKPVPLAAVASQFNALAKTCPIWVDDECVALQSGAVDSTAFREMLAGRSRYVEPKGRERELVLGCARIGLTANDLGAIRFGDVAGADSIDAIADRLAVFLVRDPAAARAALRALWRADDVVDLPRVAGHMAWLQATRVPRPGRFYGAPTAGRETALSVAAAGAWTGSADVVNWLDRALDSDVGVPGALWIESPDVWTGSDYAVWVVPTAIAAQLSRDGAADVRTLERVREALAPFRRGARRRVRAGSGLVWAWPLDAALLSSALG